MKKINLMKKIASGKMNCSIGDFEALQGEFERHVRIAKREDFGRIDSDEALYEFYAHAFLSGYRLSKNEGVE